MWKWELGWFPWKQTACSFACVALASDVRPASPSGQGCNLIKHFGAGSPFPPITLLKTMRWLPKHRVTAGKCSAAHPHAVCTSLMWLHEFQFLRPTSLISCASPTPHPPPQLLPVAAASGGRFYHVPGLTPRQLSQRSYLILMIHY